MMNTVLAPYPVPEPTRWCGSGLVSHERAENQGIHPFSPGNGRLERGESGAPHFSALVMNATRVVSFDRAADIIASSTMSVDRCR
jgi:hypothetical protein